MKILKALALTFLLFYSLKSFSYQWFNVQANCYINNYSSASCQACNWNSYRPMFCHMNVSAQSSRGAFFNAFQNGYVYPGQCITGFVRANNPYFDPLVFAQANVRCRF